MKTLLLLLTALALTSAIAADKRFNAHTARTVYFPDGSRTESSTNTDVREQTEITYSAQGTKIARRVYLLNERGLPTQGNIYDGRDQLKARARFLFDEFGRMSEQQMSNLQGEIFQRVVFSYDAEGNQSTPKSYNYNVSAPDMKAQALDFTQPQREAPHYDRSQGNVQPAQGNVPYLPGGAASSGLAPIEMGMDGRDRNSAEPSQQQPEKKSGFSLRNLFKRKSKPEAAK
jgi:hypothetical protein